MSNSTERHAVIAFLRKCADECEIEWTTRGPNAEMGLAACEALREAAEQIGRGEHERKLDPEAER